MESGKDPAGEAAPPAPAQPADPGAHLLVRIGDFLEPLTRFDRNHLSMSESRHEIVPVLARQVFRLSFETRTREGNGALPAGVEPEADEAALARESQAQLDAVRAAAPARLAAWAEAQGEDPHARPQLSDCFTALTPLGVVETCAACTGAGRIACEVCKGAGNVDCPVCKGAGATDCEACEARGAVSCQTCKGVGTILEQKERKVWDEVIDQHRVEHYQELAPCPVCNKAGSVPCRRCTGSGQVPCLECEGKKTIACEPCSGTGSHICAACGGYGKRHRVAELVGYIHETFEAAPRTDDKEIAAVFKSPEFKANSGIDIVLRMAATHHSTAEASAHTLRRDTQAEIPITTAHISVGEHGRALIRGFGPDQEVRDYRNLAGMLLTGDMVQLDSAIAMTSLMPPKVNETIYEALSNVLLSETNAAVAMMKGKTPEEVERGVRGVVTADYIKRASHAINTAISRAYWAGIARLPAFALALPLTFAPLDLMMRGSGAASRVGLLLVVMVLTVGLCAIGHLLVVDSLQKRIAPDGQIKLGLLVDRLGLTRMWLIGAGAFAAMLALIVAGLTSWIFPSH